MPNQRPVATESERQIRALVSAIRARWLAARCLRVVIEGALSVAAVLVVALVAVHAADGHLRVVLAIVAAGVVTGVAGILWPFRLLAHRPSDARVSRFIEERAPSLEDRLVSATEILTAHESRSSPLAGPMVADAARRAQGVSLDDIVPMALLRRAAIEAAATVLIVVAILGVGREPARAALDAVRLVAFPIHARLDVTPGDARVVAGNPLGIDARVVDSRAPVGAQLEISETGPWRTVPMPKVGDRFRFELESVTSPFIYRVVAGPMVSATYSVAVVAPPRVVRIDVEYTYPPELGLDPRSDRDAGDLYAPAGTTARLRVFTDRPALSGRLSLGRGGTRPLAAEGAAALSGEIRIVGDDTYRVALADREGVSSAGDEEYFIRILADRSPEVRILKPAVDRTVTKLEEVEIEARADDDYGIDRMEFVYAIGGGPERAVPLRIPRHASSVVTRHLLPMEDLDVQPGDFVSYYVRAHDVARGRRSSEGRSDIFFLEVGPFGQALRLAQSQAMAGSGHTGSLDELINAQKQVVVATWKLNRRAESTKATPRTDLHLLSQTERRLATRVEQVSSSFRESAMRAPSRPGSRGGSAGPQGVRAGETTVEEDDMTAAARAMERAAVALDASKIREALSAEMAALDHLGKAQAEIRRRQIMMQQAAAGAGGTANQNVDVSTLFDRELQRTQRTNYETPSSRPEEKGEESDLLGPVRDLARRQDELLRRQRELARPDAGTGADERRRELARLAREQLALRQAADDMARQVEQLGRAQEGRGPAAQNNGPSPASAGGAVGERLREASEEMRNAANRLVRDPAQAAEPGGRALETLRGLERQLQHPSGRGQADSARGPGSAEARRLADQAARTAQLKDQVTRLGQEIEALAAGRGGQKGDQAALAQRREEYIRRVDEARQLLDEVRRGDPSKDQGGRGVTFEQPGAMTLSAPGTEAFKQDFARWDGLRRQVTEALERAQASLSARLTAQSAKDRFTVGPGDEAPAEYEAAVDRYFEALATKETR